MDKFSELYINRLLEISGRMNKQAGVLGDAAQTAKGLWQTGTGLALKANPLALFSRFGKFPNSLSIVGGRMSAAGDKLMGKGKSAIAAGTQSVRDSIGNTAAEARDLIRAYLSNKIRGGRKRVAEAAGTAHDYAIGKLNDAREALGRLA